MDARERIREGLQRRDTDADEVIDIIEAATALQSAMYKRDKGKEDKYLFRLRKALEGIFGHDIPVEGEEE